ncbi:MAG: hypothetical protein KDB21_18345, partial [Acidimicrobiales bacterium]|nr:hypothetical protein [Acidimicrobiales bacterium]
GVGHAGGHGHADVAADTGELRYEVMFFLDGPDEGIGAFKQRWSEVGDSIVVVGGDGLWNCHIHCDDIGAAIEAALDHGRPSRIRVTDLLEQVEHLDHYDELGDVVTLLDPAAVTTATVAVGVGPGVRRIFESLGVKAVVMGGQTMNPSTAQLLQAVEQVPADQVVLLPNNKNIIPVAQQVDLQTDKVVRVVPTRSVAEGFAALLAYDPAAAAEDNLATMTEAAEAVVAGEVTQAVRDAAWSGGSIAEGQWLGIARDGIRAVADDLLGAVVTLLDELVTADHELVTVIVGADADEACTAAVEAWLAEQRPDVEVEVHDGGQPLYPYLVGIE